jgi:hypothetical protein
MTRACEFMQFNFQSERDFGKGIANQRLEHPRIAFGVLFLTSEGLITVVA